MKRQDDGQSNQQPKQGPQLPVRLEDLRAACKNHPDFATIIHAVIQARENGPEPRHQKQHPHWSPYEYGKRQ